jgi:transcriptional regulator with XRE-family HTH domain
MMSNKEKFKALVSTEKTNTVAQNRARIKSRAMLREAQSIALKVLDRLDELNWSQRELAKQLEVTPQQITKIVSGQENLTLATQTKLQELLDIPILASYYENKKNELISKEYRSKNVYQPNTIDVAKISDNNKSAAVHIILPYPDQSKQYDYQIAQ